MCFNGSSACDTGQTCESLKSILSSNLMGRKSTGQTSLREHVQRKIQKMTSTWSNSSHQRLVIQSINDIQPIVRLLNEFTLKSSFISSSVEDLRDLKYELQHFSFISSLIKGSELLACYRCSSICVFLFPSCV